MTSILQSPWLTVTLAIVVMTIGYSIYLVENGNIAQASYSCPAMEICDADTCKKDGSCSEANCKSCPRCKKEATS